MISLILVSSEIMVEINVKIEDELIDDLSEVCWENNLNLEELVLNYIQQGLDNYKGVGSMSLISLDGDVMEKVNIVVKLTDQTPEEVVNEALRDQLRTVEDIPDNVDYEKIWNALDHDKPEGDDILDNLVRLGEQGFD
ncbi:MAG: hypothetical protein E7Z80_09685 [Methanobrevibacter thaueri]|nr:hypothetical protein [Methanobrevibacter thaueri]